MTDAAHGLSSIGGLSVARTYEHNGRAPTDITLTQRYASIDHLGWTKARNLTIGGHPTIAYTQAQQAMLVWDDRSTHISVDAFGRQALERVEGLATALHS